MYNAQRGCLRLGCRCATTYHPPLYTLSTTICSICPAAGILSSDFISSSLSFSVSHTTLVLVFFSFVQHSNLFNTSILLNMYFDEANKNENKNVERECALLLPHNSCIKLCNARLSSLLGEQSRRCVEPTSRAFSLYMRLSLLPIWTYRFTGNHGGSKTRMQYM